MLRFGDVAKLRRAFVKDISKGGMFVRSSSPKPVGARVRVVLELPDGSQFPLEGEAVSVNDAQDGTGGNGVRFTDLDAPRMGLLDRYIAAREAGAPHPMDGSVADLSVGHVIDKEVEERLQEKLFETATSLASIMGDEAPRTPTAEFLMRLDRALREVEGLSSSDPYEVLGVEEQASFDEVREVLEERLTDFTIDESLGKLPSLLNARIDAAKGKLWEAAGILCDPEGRAAIDIAHGRLRPATEEPAVQEAFENQLRTWREQATEEQRAEFALSDPYVELAAERQRMGDLKSTRTLLQAALMYDPHNLGIRNAIISVRDEMIAAQPKPERLAPAQGSFTAGPIPRVEPVEPEEIDAPARSKTGLILGILGAVALLGVGGAVLAMQSGDDAEQPAPVETDATTAPPSPQPPANGAPEKTEPAAPAPTEGAPTEAAPEDTTGEADGAPGAPGASGSGETPEPTSPDVAAPPSPVEGSFAEVHALLTAGEFEQAYTLAKTYTKGKHQKDAYRWMTLAACHQRRGVKARRAFQHIAGKKARLELRERCAELGIDVTARTKGETPREMYYRALEAEEAGDHKKACYLATQSNFKKPSADTMVMSGGCACRQGKVGRAKKLRRLLEPSDRPRLDERCKALGVEL